MITRKLGAATVAASALVVLALAGCGQQGQTAAASGRTAQAAKAVPAPTTPPPATPAAANPAPTTPAAAATAPSTAPDTSIKVYADCRSPSVEPKEIILTCADADTAIEDLVWTSWTATRATATGTLSYDDCKPNCAEGHFHKVPGAQVVLTDAKSAAYGGLAWTQITSSAWPPGYATGPLHGGPFPLAPGPQ